MATPVLQLADVRASSVVGAVVTGTRVVGAFGTSVALPMPIARVWVGTDTYAVNDVVVYNAVPATPTAWKCLVIQAAGSAAPVAGVNWQQLTGPFSGNTQTGSMPMTLQAVTDLGGQLYVPGLAVGAPVLITEASTVSARTYACSCGAANVLSVGISANAVAAAAVTLSWAALSFPQP
jgi:hypothetical protein